MRVTIERIRTLVLAAGVLLVVVLAAFLAIGKWRSPFNRRDIPKHLGMDIQQEARGVTYTQAHGGHTIFKIHAARVIQLKNDKATLHDVSIELYGQNGSGIDRIQGNQFQYDQRTGIATAAGPVEITLMRPAAGEGAKPGMAAGSGAGAIHVMTSGLVFNQRTGVVSTDRRVNFSTAQASGSAVGATFDSDQGLLVLNRAVELTTRRGANLVELRAEHADYDRNAEIGHLRGATASAGSDHATAAEAVIAFRDDGSIESLAGSGGVTVSTDAGSRLAAPRGTLAFDSRNLPQSGRFTGGVTLQSANDGRAMSGSAPVMTLAFDAGGQLRRAHLEDGVELRSIVQGGTAGKSRAASVRSTRTWRSAIADVDFRQVKGPVKGPVKGQVEGRLEPATLNGSGGVVVTAESRSGSEPAAQSRLTADRATGIFGPDSTLTAMIGYGHAKIEETTAAGAYQVATGDRLEAQFASVAGSAPPVSGDRMQIQSARLEGNVTLLQQPAARPGARPEAPLRATAARADYEAAGQWLHLAGSPRVEDGGMVLTATGVDVSRQSGDAFARGNVKATWLQAPDARSAPGGATGLGGKGPVHAIAAEAELHQPGGEATFRGHARLWQQDNSISAPVIVMNRQKQTLIARAQSSAEPVVAVLLDAQARTAETAAGPGKRSSQPSVVRVQGGDFRYSAIERRAIMRAAPLSAVTAQSDGVESHSAQVELFLAAPGAVQNPAAPAQVERMTALGHVVLTSQDRRGAGEQLVYTGRDGKYVLTGTPSAPPRFTDPQRGTVTGAALIFDSRDDSVSIEGGGHETTTETTAPALGRGAR